MKTTLLRNMLAAVATLLVATFVLPHRAMAQTKEAYVVKSTDGKSLTFYYDTQKAMRTGTVYGITDTQDYEGTLIPAWTGTPKTPNTKLTQATFDASFSEYRPSTTQYWFFCLTALRRIDGIAHLNTSEVTDMEGMFYGCSALASLDISNFNTSEVTEMNEMFYGCSALTSLDLSKFNTEKVTIMIGMFSNCSSLTTIYCNDDWNREGIESNGMFWECTNMKGAVAYDATKTDATMANPTTGYFTKKAVDGIEQTQASANGKPTIHNLRGQRMQGEPQGLSKGIYIINGQKVLKQ